jgi:MFS family permease
LRRRPSVAQYPKISIDYLGATLLVATTTTLVLIFDRRTHEIIGAGMKVALALLLIGCFAALIIHESKTKSPFVNLSLFRIRRFAFSVVSLLIIAMCYSLIGFLMPFYLQDILDLSPTAVGFLFMAPSILTVAFAPLSGSLSDRFGPRTPATLGAAIMVLALGVGGLLKTDSHWLLPALLIVLSAITNGLFNPANSTAMIGMMPREHRGFASSMNHVTFGVGNVLGIALGSFVMAIAFEFYTGLAGASPTTENPAGFVAAINTTFLAATVLSVGAVAASVARGNGPR